MHAPAAGWPPVRAGVGGSPSHRPRDPIVALAGDEESPGGVRLGTCSDNAARMLVVVARWSKSGVEWCSGRFWIGTGGRRSESLDCVHGDRTRSSPREAAWLDAVDRAEMIAYHTYPPGVRWIHSVRATPDRVVGVRVHGATPFGHMSCPNDGAVAILQLVPSDLRFHPVRTHRWCVRHQRRDTRCELVELWSPSRWP